MRLRGGWPLAVFVVALVAVPILEVWLLVQVGRQIGVLPTVAILVVEALLGAWLMRREGGRAWKALTDAIGSGKVPHGQLADAALVLVGGILLMLPGFATDIIGFIFLLPWTRPIGRKIIAFFVARRLNRMGLPVARARVDRDNLIPGETVPDADPGAGRPGPVVISGEIETTQTP